MDKNLTIIDSQCFKCTICDHISSRKYDHERHLKTQKHEKKRKIREKNEELRKTDGCLRETDGCLRENKITEENTKEKTIQTRYCCDYCEFSTTIKKESEKHRKSKQHIRNENKEEDFLEIVTRYVCVKCDIVYDKYKSCWEHSKKCKGKPTEEKENIVFEIVETKPEISMEIIKKDIMETIVEKFLDNNKYIMDNNKYMMEQIVSVVKTVIMETQIQPHHSVAQNNNSNNTQTNNVVNSNSNSNNTTNHCTINMFLNDKCKDAMNVGDFVENMKIDFENLHYNAEHGFQKGLTKMFVDNLNVLSIYKRPIHFTDLKRDIMYIKDANEWTKHENSDKLVEMLEWAARQGIRCFAEWMEENAPAYHDLDSHLGKLYMKIHQTVIRGQNDRSKAFPKVLKEVARATHLRKEDQT
jgi:hypothetical protein